MLFPVMSKKKEKEKDKGPDIEDEISRLCDNVGTGKLSETSQTAEPPGFHGFLNNFLKQQASQHTEFMKTLATSSQANIQAVVTAVKDTVGAAVPRPPQAPLTRVPPPTQVPILHVPPAAQALPVPQCPVPEGLFTYEPDDDLEGYSDEDELDFHGWEAAPGGQESYCDTASYETGPAQVPPSEPAPSSSQVAQPPMAPEGLFNEYDQTPNWRGAPEIFVWLESIINKEVPAAALKTINETFTPEQKYQHLFAVPVLPQAISDRLSAAPKGLAKVPRMVNDTLIRSVSIFWFYLTHF